MLRNLIENTLKFTRGRDGARVQVDGRVENHALLLWLRDNGIGFDMKYHDRNFDIIQRLHRGEDYPGSGIGLALGKKAVTRMGGRVWAQRAPGEGATFFVELPQ